MEMFVAVPQPARSQFGASGGIGQTYQRGRVLLQQHPAKYSDSLMQMAASYVNLSDVCTVTFIALNVHPF